MDRIESQQKLSSVLQIWFLGKREDQDLHLSPLKRILFFIAISVLLFFFCWLFFDAVRVVYYELLSQSTELLYPVFGRDLDFSVKQGLIVFQSLRVPFFEADLSPVGVVANTALCWTLILSTPGMIMRNRLLAIGGGSLLLLLSQTIFMMTKVEVALIGAQHPLARNEPFWRFLDDFFEVTGKGFFPVLIWLGFSLKYMLGTVDIRLRVQSVSRNAPCPCGSGKKYKRCCGR